jgi:hypothetical protein
VRDPAHKEVAVPNNKTKWVAAVASVTFLAACSQVPSWNAPAPASSAANPAPPAGLPVTVSCAQGQQALVKQVTLGGQTVSQVECVTMPLVASRELNVLEDTAFTVPQPAPRRVAPPRRVVRPVVREEVVREEVVREEEVVSEEPTVHRTSTSPSPSTSSRDAEPEATQPVRKTRSGEKSALIIAGSTAAGAGVGAIVGGKRGAIIGGILGGVGGTVYDRKTRHPK